MRKSTMLCVMLMFMGFNVMAFDDVHKDCIECHQEKGIDLTVLPDEHILVPYCADCHKPAPPESNLRGIPKELLDEDYLNELMFPPGVASDLPKIMQQERCIGCHGDDNVMSLMSDEFFSPYEQFTHTLLIRNVTFYLPENNPIIMVIPTDGVDVIKDPAEICTLGAELFPGMIAVRTVYLGRANGDNVEHTCELMIKVRG